MVVEHNKTNSRAAVNKLSYPRTAIPEGTNTISDNIITINRHIMVVELNKTNIGDVVD